MTLVIDNVRIVEGPGNPPLGEGRVVIEGERITAAGPRAGAGPYGAPIEVPPGAEIIDGTGKSVVPGLIDVHVHDASDANMALYVKSGSAREAAEAGMDGLENTSRIPEDPGFSHERLHARHSVSGRIATLAHLWSTADKYRLEDIGGLLAERGVWLAPELVSFEAWAGLSEKEVKAERDWPQGQDPRVTQYDRHNAYISSEWTKDDFAAQARALEAMKEFLGAFVKAGGSLVTGTDLGFGGILLHRELRHFADFLTPLETIRTATRAAASALGRDDLGQLAPGRTADLVLLEGYPSTDPGQLRSVVATIIGGRVVYQRERAAAGAPS